MTKAWNDRKLGVLTDLPASSIVATILTNEAIVMAAQPTEGTSALSQRHDRAHEDFEVTMASGAMPATQTEQPDPPINGRSGVASPKNQPTP